MQLQHDPSRKSNRLVVRITTLVDWGARAVEVYLRALFYPEVEAHQRWFAWSVLIACYLTGIYFWGSFLSWGRFNYNYEDWAQINLPRIAFVRDALSKGQFPLHMSETAHLHGLTDRYLSMHDVILSPQMIVLPFMHVTTYVVINTLGFYSLGFLGLLWLRRRFSLSLLSFIILFALTNLNGHLIAHIAVGHITWWVNFLFPLFVALIFQALDGSQGWRWTACVAFLLFFIYLNGGFHQFVWLLIFLILLGAAARRLLRLMFQTVVATICLSLFRILPPILLLGSFDKAMLGGYPTLLKVLEGLAVFKVPGQDFVLIAADVASPVGWWEFDLYIGVVGTTFILLAGILGWLRWSKSHPTYQELSFPVAFTFALSIGDLQRWVRWVPIFAGERVTSRIIYMPFIFLAVLAVIRYQYWLQDHKLPAAALAAQGVLVLVGVNEMWLQGSLWKVDQALKAFSITPVDLKIKIVMNHPDPAYFLMVGIGAALSLLTAVFLIWKAMHSEGATKDHGEEDGI